MVESAFSSWKRCATQMLSGILSFEWLCPIPSSAACTSCSAVARLGSLRAHTPFVQITVFQRIMPLYSRLRNGWISESSAWKFSWEVTASSTGQDLIQLSPLEMLMLQTPLVRFQAVVFPSKNPTNNLPCYRMKYEPVFFLISTSKPATLWMQSRFPHRQPSNPDAIFKWNCHECDSACEWQVCVAAVNKTAFTWMGPEH